jgi:DNA-binding XRE family transcriptional regulator
MNVRLDGAKIRAAREALGLTQPEFAQRAGVGRDTLVKIENGRMVIGTSVPVARCIAEFMGVPLEAIAVGPPTPHHRPDRVVTTPESGRRSRRQPSPDRKG